MVNPLQGNEICDSAGLMPFLGTRASGPQPLPFLGTRASGPQHF